MIRRTDWSWDTFAAELTRDAKDQDPRCTYSRRTLQDFKADPQKVRRKTARGYRQEYIHRWLTSKLSEWGEVEANARYLDVIAPEKQFAFEIKDRVKEIGDKINDIVMRATTPTQLVNELSGLISIDDEKRCFGENIRAASKRLRITDGAFNSAIRTGGMPPNRPQDRPSDIQDYIKRLEIGDIPLSKSQKLVWKVATELYPLRKKDRVEPNFKNSARNMAYFFNRSILRSRELRSFEIALDMATKFRHLEGEVAFLCWLELPLLTHTDHPSLAKRDLYAMGAAFKLL